MNNINENENVSLISHGDNSDNKIEMSKTECSSSQKNISEEITSRNQQSLIAENNSNSYNEVLSNPPEQIDFNSINATFDEMNESFYSCNESIDVNSIDIITVNNCDENETSSENLMNHHHHHIVGNHEETLEILNESEKTSTLASASEDENQSSSLSLTNQMPASISDDQDETMKEMQKENNAEAKEVDKNVKEEIPVAIQTFTFVLEDYNDSTTSSKPMEVVIDKVETPKESVIVPKEDTIKPKQLNLSTLTIPSDENTIQNIDLWISYLNNCTQFLENVLSSPHQNRVLLLPFLKQFHHSLKIIPTNLLSPFILSSCQGNFLKNSIEIFNIILKDYSKFQEDENMIKILFEMTNIFILMSRDHPVFACQLSSTNEAFIQAMNIFFPSLLMTIEVGEPPMMTSVHFGNLLNNCIDLFCNLLPHKIAQSKFCFNHLQLSLMKYLKSIHEIHRQMKIFILLSLIINNNDVDGDYVQEEFAMEFIELLINKEYLIQWLFHWSIANDADPVAVDPLFHLSFLKAIQLILTKWKFIRPYFLISTNGINILIQLIGRFYFSQRQPTSELARNILEQLFQYTFHEEIYVTEQWELKNFISSLDDKSTRQLLVEMSYLNYCDSENNDEKKTFSPMTSMVVDPVGLSPSSSTAIEIERENSEAKPTTDLIEWEKPVEIVDSSRTTTSATQTAKANEPEGIQLFHLTVPQGEAIQNIYSWQFYLMQCSALLEKYILALHQGELLQLMEKFHHSLHSLVPKELLPDYITMSTEQGFLGFSIQLFKLIIENSNEFENEISLKLLSIMSRIYIFMSSQSEMFCFFLSLDETFCDIIKLILPTLLANNPFKNDFIYQLTNHVIGLLCNILRHTESRVQVMIHLCDFKLDLINYLDLIIEEKDQVNIFIALCYLMDDKDKNMQCECLDVMNNVVVKWLSKWTVNANKSPIVYGYFYSELLQGISVLLTWDFVKNYLFSHFYIVKVIQPICFSKYEEEKKWAIEILKELSTVEFVMTMKNKENYQVKQKEIKEFIDSIK